MGWQSSFHDLTGYVSQNPAIKISDRLIIIPEELRPGFYSLFDNLRHSFVEECLGGVLPQVKMVVQSYNHLASGLCAELGLSSVSLQPPAARFMSEPVRALADEIVARAWELIKGKDSPEIFAASASEAIQVIAAERYHAAYQYWATLSLIGNFKPRQCFVVDVPTEATDPGLSEDQVLPGLRWEEPPKLEPASGIPLWLDPHSSFIVPNLIFWSDVTGCFVALRLAFYDTFRHARGLSDRVTWIKIPEIHGTCGKHDIWPDMALYLGQKAEDLCIVSDYTNTMQPALIAEFKEQPGWLDAQQIASLSRHLEALQPTTGSCAMCLSPLIGSQMPWSRRRGYRHSEKGLPARL
jgi:hypothetical protein